MTRIAVVDNEPVWVASMARAVAREGYSTQLIGDADAAVDRVAVEQPDVVILDRELPRLDGLPLAAVLQEELGERCPPLILVTTRLVAVALEERDRFEAVFEKPVSPAYVMRAVRRLARGQRSSGAIAVAEVAAEGAAREEAG